MSNQPPYFDKTSYPSYTYGPSAQPMAPMGTSQWGVSYRSRGVALVLALVGFLGLGGLHRFYAGKWGTGTLWLLTAGLGGFGTLVDVVLLCAGSFRDREGNLVLKWDW